MDNYTRFLLTVIAVALCTIALQGRSPISPAHAAERVECTLSGPLTIGDFRDTLNVEVSMKSYEPGSSSSAPLFVRQVD